MRLPAEVARLAEWSRWVKFTTALSTAPSDPGVYLVRSGTGPVVYVGMAGERGGKGLRGRFAAYRSGRVSGLGAAALNEALADADWLRERLTEVENGDPSRVAAWVRRALDRGALSVCWATTADKPAAQHLERDAIAILRHNGHLLNVQGRITRDRGY